MSHNFVIICISFSGVSNLVPTEDRIFSKTSTSSEIFPSLTVRKSLGAEVVERELAATLLNLS